MGCGSENIIMFERAIKFTSKNHNQLFEDCAEKRVRTKKVNLKKSRFLKPKKLAFVECVKSSLVFSQNRNNLTLSILNSLN